MPCAHLPYTATTFLIWQPPSLYGNHLPYMVTTFLIRQDLLVAERASTWAQCVGWARRKYESYFVSRIAQVQTYLLTRNSMTYLLTYLPTHNLHVIAAAGDVSRRLYHVQRRALLVAAEGAPSSAHPFYLID